MGVTGKRWCDFLVYTLDSVHLERIMFNQRGCRLQILDAAESSFNNHIAPELVHCNTSGSLSVNAAEKRLKKVV